MTKIYQVEFLVEGNLLPMTIGRLQVSENLILESAWEPEKSLTGRHRSFALAYVGVEDDPQPSSFLFERDYLDFFLLIHSLITGQPTTQCMGAGTEIPDLAMLGSRRVSFPDYEKITVLDENLESEFSKPILLAKERFLELEKDREAIMNGYLGLALRYYYFALQANERGHLDEVVVNLVIAAEAIVSTGEKYTENFKRRIPILISDNESIRAYIEKELGCFYGLRGAIVHGGRKEIILDDVRRVSGYIARAIDEALSLRYFSKEELINFLENKQKTIQ
jgi:hypothetical protein